MGVKDLWKILECVGHPVTLESLEGLVIAVDVSIWLNQAVKGARDRQGEMLKGAHLAVLFSRICKLLHYRIKPVFVFDGPPPTLKLQTLRSRNQRRRATSQKLLKNADKRMTKYLQASILGQVSGEEGHKGPPAKPSNDDLFWLPPLPDHSAEESMLASSHSDDGDHGDDDLAADLYHHELADLDVHSEQFASLPPETQHDLLLEKQRYNKYTYHHPSTLPQVADDFSRYQLAGLVKRSRVSEKLECVRRVLKSGEAAVAVGDVTKVRHVETNRVVSSDHTHYILVKGSDLESSLADNDSVSGVWEPLGPEHVRNMGENMGENLWDSPNMGVRHDVDREREAGSSDRTRPLIAPMPAPGCSYCSPPSAVTDAISQGCNFNYSPPPAMMNVISQGCTSNYSPPSAVMNMISQGCNSNYSPPPAVMDVISHVGSTAGPIISSSRTDTKMAELSSSLATSTDSLAVPVTHAVLRTEGSCSEAVEGVVTPLDRLSVALATISGICDDAGCDGEEACDGLPGWSGEEGIFGSGDGAPLRGTGDKSKDLLDREGPTAPPFGASLKTVSSQQFISSSEGEELEDKGVVDNHHGPWTKTSGLMEDAAIVVDHGDNTAIVVDHGDNTAIVVDHGDNTAIVMDDDRAASTSPHATADTAGREMESLLEMPVDVARDQVRREVEVLEEERNRQQRDEATVETHMYQDARELLSLFGIPYVLSPGEAEAQCATLELLNLTNGTITDDNDVFLFGGSTVYRHFFSQDHHPEKYTLEEIRGQLGLSREHLILLTYLLGSDYTDGLEGIGTVLATEFLDEFKLDGFQSLQAFKEWHSNIPLEVNQKTPLKRKLSQLVLPHGFPNEAVRDAYLNPCVDQSKETFSWSKPDLDLIRKFAASHIGWSSAKADGILLPVIKKMNAPESQQKMTRFIVPLHPSPGKKKMAAMSKRMRKAVDKLRSSKAYTTDKLKGLSSSGSDSDESGSCTSLAKRPRGKGKGKGASNERSPGQRSPGQGAESTGSDMEFDSLAREIILREQACVTGAGQCVTEEPCLLQGIDAGGKKGWGRRRHWSGK